MAAIGSTIWKIILAVAAVAFIGAMSVFGFFIPLLFFLVLAVVGGAIALLTRKSNPPPT